MEYIFEFYKGANNNYQPHIIIVGLKQYSVIGV